MESSIFVSVPNKGVKLQVKVDLRFYLSQTVIEFDQTADICITRIDISLIQMHILS